MAWTSLTFAFGSKLTSTKMTQLYDNFQAFAAKASGAPTLASGYVTEAMLSSAIVSQGKLRTTTGDVSIGMGPNGSGSTGVLPGGQYGWRIQVFKSGSGAPQVTGYGSPVLTTSLSSLHVNFTNTNSSSSVTGVARERYVQASPPYESYRAGDPIPLFIFARIDKTTGKVISTYVAEDPPWANNGPTVINPLGRVQTYVRSLFPESPSDDDVIEMLRLLRNPDPAKDAEFIKRVRAMLSEPVPQEMKNRDMALIPHPFPDYNPTKEQVVVLNPCDNKACRALQARHTVLGDSIPQMLHEDRFIIDNTPMANLVTPPGVIAVQARLR